ncbi:MAG TPA: hypothetical protein VG722_01855, partial [Tepidisphaeraceae bacterium]|nr:hypothetical protein [Tepidisphaeraceae bacterium]
MARVRPIDIESLEQRLCLAASITLDLGQTQQTIQGLGGNYARGKYGDFYVESNDKIGQYTLANLHPQSARVGIPLRGWEPANDNSDPNTINWAGFGTTVPAVNNVFLLMQDLSSRGIPIIGTVWDVPSWMVSNPTNTTFRKVPSSNYGELIESIASFLVRAQNTFNVRVDYLSFNEPDGGFRLYWTSSQMANFIAQAGPEFAQYGLNYTPKFLVGDTGNASTLVSFAQPILANAAAAPYLGPIAFHGWDSLSYADSVFQGIVSLAQQYNKQVWCTEEGYDALANTRNPLPFNT